MRSTGTKQSVGGAQPVVAALLAVQPLTADDQGLFRPLLALDLRLPPPNLWTSSSGVAQGTLSIIRPCFPSWGGEGMAGSLVGGTGPQNLPTEESSVAETSLRCSRQSRSRGGALGVLGPAVSPLRCLQKGCCAGNSLGMRMVDDLLSAAVNSVSAGLPSLSPANEFLSWNGSLVRMPHRPNFI